MKNATRVVPTTLLRDYPRTKLAVALAIFFLLGSVVADAQIYRLAEMNTRQISALDRQKTVILMPGGVMEEHGPHLPSFSDGYMNDYVTERLAQEVAKRPGWKAVIFPMIPLGDGGANEIGFKYIFPGTYGVRVKTLRAVYMDLGTEFGEQGFKWIFVIQGHGSPMHNLALDQAGDYFHDTYGGQMINLMGRDIADATPQTVLPESFQKENGIDIHAGASETSRLLFLKPSLVDAAYKRLSPVSILDPDTFSSTAMGENWPGYFGSPRLANAAYGRRLMGQISQTAATIMLRMIDGEDPSGFPRYADDAMKSEAKVAAKAFEYDAKVEERQREWLRKKGIE